MNILIEKAATDNNLSIRDFLEVRKRSLSEHLPPLAQTKKVWTMYGLCIRYLDLLVSRYGSLESAMEMGEKGEAFIAQAIQKRNDPRGGVCGWLKRHFDKAGCSHPTVLSARDRLEEMGVIAYDSNGRANVGFTRVNVLDALVLVALLEDVLEIVPEQSEYAGDEQLSAGFWLDYVGERNPVVKMAKVLRRRWQRFFGCNPRSKAESYDYPYEIEAIAAQVWSSVAKVAKPITTIPAALIEETEKYCLNRAESILGKVRAVVQDAFTPAESVPW